MGDVGWVVAHPAQFGSWQAFESVVLLGRASGFVG